MKGGWVDDAEGELALQFQQVWVSGHDDIRLLLNGEVQDGDVLSIADLLPAALSQVLEQRLRSVFRVGDIDRCARQITRWLLRMVRIAIQKLVAACNDRGIITAIPDRR